MQLGLLTYLLFWKDGVEIGEGRETEEDVHYVGGEVYAFLPVISQHTSQRKKKRL